MKSRLSAVLRTALVLVALVFAGDRPAEAQESQAFLPAGEYRIIVMANARMVHANDLGDRLTSTRYQVLDDYSVFFLAPISNGTYEFTVKASGLSLHVDGGGDRLLSTRYQPHDSFARFRIFRVRDDLGGYRIQVVATGRFLHEDGLGDRLLSTRYQVDDPFSRFAIIPYRP